MDYEQYDLTPYDEDCAQIGETDYAKRSALEYIAICEQLIRSFGNPSEHQVYFSKMRNSHDFGTYYDLKISYEEWNDYMRNIDSNFPQHWDSQAIEYLKEHDYFRSKND